jgi:hypothetical protein
MRRILPAGGGPRQSSRSAIHVFSTSGTAQAAASWMVADKLRTLPRQTDFMLDHLARLVGQARAAACCLRAAHGYATVASASRSLPGTTSGSSPPSSSTSPSAPSSAPASALSSPTASDSRRCQRSIRNSHRSSPRLLEQHTEGDSIRAMRHGRSLDTNGQETRDPR